jgi:hypothetical protein
MKRRSSAHACACRQKGSLQNLKAAGKAAEQAQKVAPAQGQDPEGDTGVSMDEEA